MSVHFDIQGVQSREHSGRGIARYVHELATALQGTRPDLVSWFLLNRDLAVPATVEAFKPKLDFGDAVRPEGRAILHIGSPIELEVSIDRLWPNALRRLRYAVTVYDLIPLLFPDVYLRFPWQRRRYRARLELIRRADRVLAISETTASDVCEHLGVAPERVVVVGAGVSEQFRPPMTRAAALDEVKRERPWLASGYVLYTGGIEPRKNIDRLLEAYATLSDEVRSAHQLVVVCNVEPADRVRLEERLRELGVSERVYFPGYVPDEQLVRLYQAAGLVVFPSLYEGFGLPIAEALACGAAVVASDTPAVVELVPERSARFDPRNVREIASTLERVLTDEGTLEGLRAKGLDPSFSWRAVAGRTAAAYEDLLTHPLRRRPRRPRVAWVSPLPPQRTGIADESYRVLAALADRCAIDAYVDGPKSEEAEPPPGVELKELGQFEAAERAHGGYERIFYCLGNSEYHTGALGQLKSRPGYVIAHDVRLTGLYGWRAHERPELDARTFPEILDSMYPGRVPKEVAEHGWIGMEEADQLGIYMAREAIAGSRRFFVHSRHAAQLARREASPGDERKIEVLPFGVPSPEELQSLASRDEPPLVATFGLVGPPKQVDKIVRALPHVLSRTKAKLAVVGPHTGAEQERGLAARADELQIADRFEQTGYVEEDELLAWLARTSVAVQLRATSNGETSAAVAKCLSAGVPTIVTNIGSAAELPDDAVLKVERDVTPEELGHAIAELLADPGRRAEMAAASRNWARARSYENLAIVLYTKVVNG